MITEIPKRDWAFNNDDTLPTEGVKNGQMAINVDTGEIFIFDEKAQQWKQQ